MVAAALFTSVSLGAGWWLLGRAGLNGVGMACALARPGGSFGGGMALVEDIKRKTGRCWEEK